MPAKPNRWHMPAKPKKQRSADDKKLDAQLVNAAEFSGFVLREVAKAAQAGNGAARKILRDAVAALRQDRLQSEIRRHLG